MYRIILLSLIFSSIIATYADSAIQTDWSGGSGILGPVIDWSDQFYLYTNVDWSSIPGAIVLRLIVEHTVDEDFDGARSVYSEDIDGDGDKDVLGAAQLDDEITWWDLPGYPLGGSLESSVLDTQVDPDWDYLEWNSQTPSGTDISFQVRASEDHAAMGEWSDTLSIPCLLDGILTDGDQYVQYRVILETSNPDTTPTLFDVMLNWDPMGIEGGENPVILALLPFSPNPASAPAVRFSLPEPASVEFTVFDLSGRLVREIHGDEYSSGYHSVLLNGLIPGIYFCRMTSSNFTATKRFVVIE